MEIDDLEKNSEAINVVRYKFNIRERVGELMLRGGEGGVQRFFINTFIVEAARWRPPFVDEDWHAICQANFKGPRGSGVGELVPQVCGDER